MIQHPPVGASRRAVPTVFLTRGLDSLAFQKREAAEVQEFWMRCGYFERAGDSLMRRTRRGAVYGALRGMFPWRQILERRDDREAERIVMAFRKHGQE